MRATAGVFPRYSATCFMAPETARLRAATVRARSLAWASATAAITVPCQVRKSLAETSSPTLLLDVGVDLRRAHVPPVLAVLVRQQFRPAPPPAQHLPHRGPHQVVGQRHVPFLARLRDVVEDHRAALDAHVLLADRRETVAVVALRVRLPADPEEAKIEKPERGTQGPLVRHSLQLQVLGHLAPRCGQSGCDGQHPVVLGLVPFDPPALVIEVLPPPRIVGAHGLKMTVGRRTDPHLLPGGRDHQQPAPLDILGCQPGARGVEVDEALAGPSPGPTRILGRDRPQSRHESVLPAATTV